MTESPTPPPVVEPRIRWAWPVLLAILLFLAINATTRTFLAEEKTDLKDERRRTEVRLEVSSPGSDDALRRSAERLAQRPETLPLRAAIRTALKEPLPEKDRRALEKAAPKMAKAFRAPLPKDRKGVDARIAEIPRTDPDRDLTRLALDRNAGIDRDSPARGGFRTGTTVAFGLFIAGCALWLVYLGGRTDEFRPRGHPAEPLTPSRSDRLALVGLLIFAIYTLGSLAGSFVPKGSGSTFFQAIVVLTVFIGGMSLFFSRTGGGASWRSLGVTTDGLGRNVLLGIVIWVMSVPLLVPAVAIATSLARFLPEPRHPVNDRLAGAGPLDTVGFFLIAAVMAPLWEELFFRGTIFPGLARWSGFGVAFGAFASSLLFAAIHPQGIALWAALGTIGAMSCFAAHHTKSLVPSIVLHTVHNTAILTLNLLSNR